MKKVEDIYKMKLGELRCEFDDSGIDGGIVMVLRVPGGWIFTTDRWGHISSVFVPFDNEFQPK